MTEHTRFRFTHISDPHLTNPLGASWRELSNKRVLGYLSWRYRRQFEYRSDVLSVVAKSACQDGSHLVITGDLTQIGLPTECEQARQWLASLGTADNISVVPGNHDAYAPSDWRTGPGLWQPWMQSDAEYRREQPADFPFIRKRGPVVFIGISSAVPTLPLLATGQVTATQLVRLSTLLADTQGYFRVLLIHHSPALGADPSRRRLLHGKALRQILAERGAELILHGHNHRPVRRQVRGPDGDIPVVGVPAASAVGVRADGSLSERRGGYCAYEVSSSDAGWQLNVMAYRLNLTDTEMEPV